MAKKQLSKKDSLIIDKVIEGLQKETRIAQIDHFDGQEKRVWIDNGGDIINFEPEKDNIKAKYRVEITQVINIDNEKKLDKIYDQLQKEMIFPNSDCDHIRADDNNVFTISCKGDIEIDRSEFGGLFGKKKDPYFDEHKRVAYRILDDMRSLKSENTRYIKDIIEQYTEDYSIDEDDL